MSAELCRLCGKDGVTNVYDETDLWRKIFVCFGVEINTSDKITQKICKSCYFFTNSVYEFRLGSIEHDNKLKKEYAEAQPKAEPEVVVPISYPSEISQDAFLNTFNLANKHEPAPKSAVYHPSVLKLKRKWPDINIPKECYELDLDPSICLEVPAKLLKLCSPKMGIWSVKSKQNRGKQPDLVLTRVHSENSSTESLNSSVSDISDKFKVKFSFKKTDNSSASNTNTPSASPGERKKKRKRYPDWSKSGRKRSTRSSPQKKIPSNKPKSPERVPQTIPKGFISPPKSENSSISVSPSGIIAKERSKLKSLLESDAQLNETLPRRPSSERSSTSLSQEFRTEEYGNLLVAARDEVQTFICQTCNKIFDTLAMLNTHKKYSHKSSLRCTKCSKRFAIVESLVKHNLACHPEKVVKANSSVPKNNLETVATVDNSETKDNPEPVTYASITTTKDNTSTIFRNSVARKHTNGSVDSNRSSFSAPTPPEILEYIISDDDDLEITDVIENTTSSDSVSNTDTNKVSTFDNILNAALEPQKPSKTEEIIANTLLCEKLIASALAEDEQKQTDEPEKLQTVESKVLTEDIFLIDDSDDEQDQNPKNSTTTKENDNADEDNSFLILDDSNSAELPALAGIKSSSSGPSTSTDSGNKKTGVNISQKIVVVPSAEDKAHMDASSSIKAKITNELSYINYIFNKCSFNHIKGDSSKPVRPAKKWFLKDIHKFTEKTYLPIEVDRISGVDVSVEYSPVPAETIQVKTPFWSTKSHIITVTKKSGPESRINPPTPPKMNIVRESSFLSQPEAKKTTTKKKPEEKPTYNQTKVNSEVRSVLKQPPLNNVGLTTQTVSSSTCLAKITNTQTPAVIQSETNVTAASPVSIVTPTSNPSSTPVSLIKTTNIQKTTSNIVSNTVFVVTSQSSSQSGNVQFMNSSPNVTLPNNPGTSNVVLPSVAASPTTLSNVQPPPNIDIHTTQRLLNLALQKATMNFSQPNSPGRSYNNTQSLTPILPKTTLPVSSPNESGVNSPEVQEPCNGFILVGVSNVPNDNGSLAEESNDNQKQPIVLNGMSYPNFAKIRNSNQPTTIVVQQLGQQTNLNIQNCVKICQQEVVTQTNTVTEQFATVPYIVQSTSAPTLTFPTGPLTQSTTAPTLTFPTGTLTQSTTAPTLTFPTGPLTLQSMSPILQSVQSPSNENENNNSESTSDATVSTTRPTIRIKNLSELRGDNLNPSQRNELHNLYSSTLTNYVQNYSNTVTNESPNDEYLQIS